MNTGMKTLLFIALFALTGGLTACNSGGSTDLGLDDNNSSQEPSILPAGVFKGGAGTRQYLAVNLHDSPNAFFWFYTAKNVSLAASTKLDGFLTGFLGSSGSFDSGTISSNSVANFDLAAADVNNASSLSGHYSSSGLSGTLVGLAENALTFQFNPLDLSSALSDQLSFSGQLIDETASIKTPVKVELTGLNAASGTLTTTSTSSCSLNNGVLKPTDLDHVYLASFVTGDCFSDETASHNGIAVIYNNRLYLSLSNSNNSTATGIVFLGH